MKKVLLAGAASLLLLGAAQAQQILNDSEVRALLTGRSALYADYSVSTFGPDGSYSYIAANNAYYRGRYTIDAGRLCMTVEGQSRQCDAVGMDRLGTFLQTPTGLQLRFTVTAPMEPQIIARVCDTTIAYSVQTPQYGVPQALRAYSGTWTGKWDFGMCAGLVIESIRADGTASVIYVNGSYGSEYSIKAGARRFVVSVLGEKFSDGGKLTSFDFKMAGSNELVITRTGHDGVSTARLYRK